MIRYRSPGCRLWNRGDFTGIGDTRLPRSSDNTGFDGTGSKERSYSHTPFVALPLNLRGSLNRDCESFSATPLGLGRLPMFPADPQALAPNTEIPAQRSTTAQFLARHAHKRKTRKLSPPGHSANLNACRIPRKMSWLPKGEPHRNLRTSVAQLYGPATALYGDSYLTAGRGGGKRFRDGHCTTSLRHVHKPAIRHYAIRRPQLIGDSLLSPKLVANLQYDHEPANHPKSDDMAHPDPTGLLDSVCGSTIPAFLC